MRIVITVGARPNFVKAAPIVKEFWKRGHLCSVLHTGQHYDYEMSKAFFEDLEIPEPDVNLGNLRKEEHVRAIKEIVMMEKPDFSIVLGDTDSSLSAALASSKVCKTVHVEAGLRSFNMKMKEEINRIVIDHVSDIHFCTEISGVINLFHEGITGILVGNVMIDSLKDVLSKTKSVDTRDFLKKSDVGNCFGVLTMHRAEKTEKDIVEIVNSVESLCSDLDCNIVFPVHPRMKKYENIYSGIKRIITVDPMRYTQFVDLLNLSSFVITDSGGIQEETSWLDVPCFTIRNETERPITCTDGTNFIVGKTGKKLSTDLVNKPKRTKGIPMWDGQASSRIVSFLEGMA